MGQRWRRPCCSSFKQGEVAEASFDLGFVMAGFRPVLPEIIAAFVAARGEQREGDGEGRQEKFWRAAGRTDAERQAESSSEAFPDREPRALCCDAAPSRPLPLLKNAPGWSNVGI